MKKEVLKIYPNAKCIWRDGPRISYEIWNGNNRLSIEHSLTARGAWESCLSHFFKNP